MPVFSSPIMKLDLNRLADNYQTLKKRAGAARAAAVVKNNAYGIGDVKVAAKLYDEGCNAFFVAHALEGKRIRPHVGASDIYVLQGIGADSAAVFQEARLTPVISTPGQLNFFENNALEGIRPVIQVETGLNRLGFHLDELKHLTDAQKKSFSYVLSHLACADEPEHVLNRAQLDAFQKIKAFFPGVPASLSATDGLFLGDEFCFDMVRLGAGLYGLNPFYPAALGGGRAHAMNAGQAPLTLKPVMHVSAPVLQIAVVPRGEFIGYGGAFKTDKDMKIATVSIGYGDGLPRSFSPRGSVRFNGQSAPLIGRVSMDNIMCDVSDIEGVREGDFADILSDAYTADALGLDAGTIGYEILSSLGKGERFCKSYIG